LVSRARSHAQTMRRPPRSSPATATSIWGCSSASRRLPRPRTEENIQSMQQAAAPPPSLRAPPTALGKFGHRRKDLGPKRSLFPQATCDLARGLASVTVPSFDPALPRRRRGPLCTGTPPRSRGARAWRASVQPTHGQHAADSRADSESPLPQMHHDPHEMVGKRRVPPGRSVQVH
jgi:hypothetical protein